MFAAVEVEDVVVAKAVGSSVPRAITSVCASLSLEVILIT